jgi:hypothetical protein
MHQITRIVESRTWMAPKQQKIHLQTDMFTEEAVSLPSRRPYSAYPARSHHILFSYSNEIFDRQFFKNMCIVLQYPEIDSVYDFKYSVFNEDT